MPRWANTAALHRKRSASLLQLALSVGVMAILMLLGLQLLLPLRGAAEQAHIQTVTGGLRSALGLETVRRILDGHNLASLQNLEGSNPILLLEQPPHNYRNELYGEPSEATRGQWYFDAGSSELAYQLRYPQYLCGSAAETIELRWRVEVQRYANRQPLSVQLRQLDEYDWNCSASTKNSAVGV